MVEGTKTRKSDIAFLNILFCIMVVFIHISSEIVTEMDRSNAMFWVVYVLSKLSCFSVSGFILLSGAKLMLGSDKMNYGRFYLSRLVSIVIPYIAWVFIYYVYFCHIGYFVFSWKDLGHYIIFGDLWAHFYFIVVIVQFYIFAPLWVFLFKRANPSVTLVITLIITLISGNIPEIVQMITGRVIGHTDILFTRYLFFWAAGCLIGAHYGEFTSYLKKRWAALILLFVLSAGAMAYLAVKCIGNEPAWMSQIYMIYSVAAILFWYMAAELITASGGGSMKPVGDIDRMTYYIYLIHCLVLVAANNYMTEHGILNLTVRYEWRGIVVYGGSILLCILWFIFKGIMKRVIDRA